MIVAAFDEDLDAFLPDAGFSTARLPEEFDVWRGGDEPAHVMARGRSWTLSYSAACAFALHCELWRDARRERPWDAVSQRKFANSRDISGATIGANGAGDLHAPPAGR